MTFGRDADLERPGESLRSLHLGEHRDSAGTSSARLYLLPNGDLSLYCTDSGWAVAMQIGEHVIEWRRWTTIAAEHVPRLFDAEPADPLEALHSAVVLDEERNAAIDIERRLAALLRERDIPSTYRQYDHF